jgi:predicted RNA-binding protein YlqC (UPF0109 family)
MSDEHRGPAAAQWGRPLRKRSRGPKSEPTAAAGPAVGPLDPAIPVGVEATIVRAERRESAPTYEVIGAPKPRASRGRGEPDEIDGQLRDLVALMARGIVDRPDDVRVDILETGEDALFELSVDPDDLGHVIGKQGRTARALRLALGAAAARRDRQAGLEIAD